VGPDGPLGGAIAQRQRLAFLAVLSGAPTGLVSRDKLLALLWSDLDAGRARKALSNALYVIKKELGEESVSAVGDDLRLDKEAVSVDALEFESAVRAGDLEEAVSLYAGPYLEGVHVKDAPEFEKWADGERDRLAALYAEALEGLATAGAEKGELTEAADWWQQLAVTDPFSSRIALALMESLAAAGDRAGALRYARVHTTLLKEEFEADPDPAVTELEERLRHEAAGPVATPPQTEPLTPASPTDSITPPAKPAQPGAVPAQTTRATEASSDGGAGAAGFVSRSQDPRKPGSPEAIFGRALNRFGRQRLVQWGLAYLAGAWFILQVMDILSEAWGLSQGIQQGAFILLFFGFLLTLVLVWYHGEEGRQRVSGPELLIIAALLVIAGGVLSVARPSAQADDPTEFTASSIEADGRLTVAVLPFQNFSPDPEDAYFADGIHEEILSKLSRISSLRVISRSSVMQFREDRPTVPEMAALLGAEYFLEGSARIVGGLVRLTAQLIRGDDEHVWSADYDHPLVLDSLIAVQSRIADSVAARLRTTLTEEERAEISRSPTDNLEAYELYLRGRFLWNQRTEPDMRRALGVFEEAIALDSLYALAYVGVANVYLTLVIT
jgi:TolB-like protein/DNA-binding SARP family transcriptional activator